MAELVDALVSGTSIRKDVEVRVFFWAPFNIKKSIIYIILGQLGDNPRKVTIHFVAFLL